MDIFTDDEVVRMVIECQPEGSWNDELSPDAISEFAQKVAITTMKKFEEMFDEWWIENSGTIPNCISHKQAKRIWTSATCTKGI